MTSEHILKNIEDMIRSYDWLIRSKNQNPSKGSIIICYQKLFCQIPRDILRNLGCIWQTFTTYFKFYVINEELMSLSWLYFAFIDNLIYFLKTHMNR